MKFFISTPLNYEVVTVQEINEIWPLLLDKNGQSTLEPIPSLKIVEGGIELETSLFLGVQLNFFLKTANRVLLRLAEFKARDLPKYYQKLVSLPWNEYLSSDNVQWKVAAQTSRLNNEKRLQESGQEAVTKKLAHLSGKQSLGSVATIYVRMQDDLCTVSLDTSGEHLHKRGWMRLRGEAPLRETWAAILLRALMEGDDTQSPSLLDPMAGSGSFLLEARSLKFPNFARHFAFQSWVNCPKLFISPNFAFNYKGLPTSFSFGAFLAIDIEPRMEEVLVQNWSSLSLQMQKLQKGAYQESSLQVFIGDSLEGVSTSPYDYMILNPPYGERLSEVTEKGESFVATLVKNYKPRRVGILLPESQKVRSPSGYKQLKTLKVNNGGIRCVFTVLTLL